MPLDLWARFVPDAKQTWDLKRAVLPRSHAREPALTPGYSNDLGSLVLPRLAFLNPLGR